MERRVQLIGHHRSGNHYAAALIEKNLFNSQDYVRHMSPSGHAFPQYTPIGNRNILFICTTRNLIDTLKSMYQFRERINLTNCNSFDQFKTKTIGELYKYGKCKNDIIINWHFKKEEVVRKSSTYFSGFKNFTLPEWHEMYCSKWIAESLRKNVLCVNYEQLNRDIKYKMLFLEKVAKFLNRVFNSGMFVDIKNRVGYFSVTDRTWQ